MTKGGFKYYNNTCQFKKRRCGGTGRRTGLKILRGLNLVPVRFRPSAPLEHQVFERIRTWCFNFKNVQSSNKSSNTFPKYEFNS